MDTNRGYQGSSLTRHVMSMLIGVIALVGPSLAAQEPRGDGLVVTTPFPGVLWLPDAPELGGSSFPRPFSFMTSMETAELYIGVGNASGSQASNVSVTLLPPEGSGIVIAQQPMAMAQLGAGAETIFVAKVETIGALPQVVELPVVISSSLGDSVDEIMLAIWDVQVTITDVGAGAFDGSASTPMTMNTLEVVAPEIFDQMGQPSYFDLQSIAFQKTFVQPFHGVHWGDPLVTRVDTLLPRGQQTTEVRYELKTSDNAPIAGYTITLRHNASGQTWTQTTDLQGKATFTNLPRSTGYTVTYTPPALLLRVYGVEADDYDFTGDLTIITSEFPPVPAGANGKAPPAANGGGGGANVKKSAVGGGLVGAGTAAVDLVAAPKTVGLTCLSLFGAALVGAGTGAAADPIDADIFFAGEEMTVPADEHELTLMEHALMSFELLQAPIDGQPMRIHSQFEFTRTTDQDVYSWVGSETLEFPLILDVAPGDSHLDETGEHVVVTARIIDTGGTLLRGSDAFVTAYLTRFDGQITHGQLPLRDDGQAPDIVAGDGAFAGAFAVPMGLSLPLDVIVVALRTGFEDPENPPALGMKTFSVSPSPACRVDYYPDGRLDFSDVVLFLQLFALGRLEADLSGDGVLSFDDVIEFLFAFHGGCP